MCNPISQRKAIGLIQSDLKPVSSALLGDNGSLTSAMKRALLEVIASMLFYFFYADVDSRSI